MTQATPTKSPQTTRRKRRAKLPAVPKREPIEVRAKVALNALNTFRIKQPGVSFLYQFDIDAPSATDDEIILEHNQSCWDQVVAVAGLESVTPGWVELFFIHTPRFGTFNLLQDPKDGEEPFFIFKDVPYEELTKVLIDAKEGDDPENDEAVSNTSDQENPPEQSSEQTES